MDSLDYKDALLATVPLIKDNEVMRYVLILLTLFLEISMNHTLLLLKRGNIIVYSKLIHMRTHAHTHTHTRTCTHAHARTHAHTHTHTRTRAHTHTHTWAMTETLCALNRIDLVAMFTLVSAWDIWICRAFTEPLFMLFMNKMMLIHQVWVA